MSRSDSMSGSGSMEVYEIGQYTVGDSKDVLDIYMVALPQRVSPEFGGPIVPPQVVYCVERFKGPAHMFIEDWLAFAHLVNRLAGEVILDIDDDPAVSEGLCVPVGMECPECGNRVMDWLCPDPGQANGESLEISCESCVTTYTPGEQ